MVRVFLSYDREDTAKAAEIALALESASHSVWWDRRIRGGAQYSKEIEEALHAADAVVVLWSKSSVESPWVRDEAAEGRDRGKLVPVSIGSAKPPIGFRQFQTVDLTKRRSRKSNDGIDQLLRAIEGVSKNSSAPEAPSEERPTDSWTPRKPALMAAAGAVLLGGLLLTLNRFTTAGSHELSAAVSSADSSPQSEGLASDLIAKLGAFAPTNGAPLRLLDTGRASSAAFLFQVGGSTEGKRTSASLLLLDGRSSSVLWSGQFERPAANIGDLRQELGYTASQVLGCALDAYRSRQIASKLDLLKSYLQSCAAAANADSADPVAEAAQFRRIIAAAPKFTGAWAKLLLIETDIPLNSPARRAQLQADIEQARKLQPDLPEIFLAELNLLPFDAYAAGLRIMDEGLRRNPDSSLLLEARSGQLLQTGRLRDAVDDAKRAAEIDPASPDIRNTYIYTLAASGRTQAAFDEIAKAERFWPGSTKIARTKYILNSRYGDPAEALAYVQSSAYQGDVQRTRVYLEARIHPTEANIERAIGVSRDGFRADDPQSLASLMQVLGIFGRQSELLDLVLRMPPSEFVPILDVLFRPTMRILWLDPRSLLLAKHIGLLKYWKTSGKWPDFCSESDLPYDCKAEAAKLGA